MEQIKPHIKCLFIDRFRSFEKTFKIKYDFLKDLNFKKNKKEVLSQGSADTSESVKVDSSQSSNSPAQLTVSIGGANNEFLEKLENKNITVSTEP